MTKLQVENANSTKCFGDYKFCNICLLLDDILSFVLCTDQLKW